MIERLFFVEKNSNIGSKGYFYRFEKGAKVSVRVFVIELKNYNF